MKWLMCAVLSVVVACGAGAGSSSQAAKVKTGVIDVSIETKPHQQGVQLAMDPVTGSTISSAGYQLLKGAGRVQTDQGNIPLERVTFIPISSVGDYCLVVDIAATDGRSGSGEACFTLGVDQLLNIAINITLGGYGQGVIVTVNVFKTTIQFTYSGDLTGPTISCSTDWSYLTSNYDEVTGKMALQGDGSYGFAGMLKNGFTYWCSVQGYQANGARGWMYEQGPYPSTSWHYRAGNTLAANGIVFPQTGSQYCGVGVAYNEILVDSAGIHIDPNPTCD